MKVTILQTDIVWASPEENIKRAEAMIGRSEDTDLYVLPEMWATGFCVEPEGIAEDEDSSLALEWMRQTACSRRCALSGSLAVRVGDGTYRNRHYFVTPEDEYHYDKHHLFSYGQEDKHFTAGSDAVVVQWQGWQLLLLTCYDLRFPVFSRYGRAGLYDAIVYVANWPEKRRDAWDVLLRARAIENQCYVIAANRTGIDPACSYNGGSAMIDPLGRIIASANEEESVLTALLSLDELGRRRQRFPVLADRDHC
ncbi:MAG: nitrilase family protein [Prevotella sp.]|nr:nitrilase family protein [Prevotella sp.]